MKGFQVLLLRKKENRRSIRCLRRKRRENITKYIAMRNYYKLTSGAEIRRLVEAGKERREEGEGSGKRDAE